MTPERSQINSTSCLVTVTNPLLLLCCLFVLPVQNAAGGVVQGKQSYNTMGTSQTTGVRLA